MVLSNVIVSGNTANTDRNIRHAGTVTVQNSVIGESGADRGVSGSDYNACLSGTPADLFIAPAAGDYRPAAGSPAIDAGDGGAYTVAFPAGISVSSEDPAGNSRFNGAIDIGAYEK
jgi:hypothetical protein